MGKPKLKWLDGLEEDLRKLKTRGWRRKALDRLKWEKILGRGQGPKWAVVPKLKVHFKVGLLQLSFLKYNTV